ncbi:MAG: Rab family GTPase [Candidatus Helarchaeota archaeon]
MIKTNVNLEKIILGVVYSIFGVRGPEPICWYPKLEYAQLEHISLKSITILAGNEGLVSDKMAVIPFPKMQLNAIIYFFEIPSEGARGNKLDGTISILINERFLSVFYKNMEMFNQIAFASIDKIKIKYPDSCTREIQNIYDNLMELLYRLYEQEQIKKSKFIDENEKAHYNYKITVIGDPGVGKTTLLLRYVDHAFRELYIPTIGVQVSSKSVIIENKLTKLVFWDVAGQQMFGDLRKRFYIGSMGVVYVYDVTRKTTFENIIKWWDDFNSAYKSKIGFLVGNKIDLTSKVPKSDAIQLANKLNLNYIETSAKNGINVDILFNELANGIYNKNMA